MAPSTSDQASLADAPWYVRTAVQVGLPTAIAATLMWFVLGDVVTTMRSVNDILKTLASNDTKIIENQRLIVEALRESAGAMRVHDDSQTRFGLYAVCVSNAATAGERNQCMVATGLGKR